MSRPENDDMTMSIGKANDIIAMSMGGRIAEEIIFKNITSGASSDIQHATKIARAMVYEWGMSKKLGFMALSSNGEVFIGRDYQTRNNFSEKLAGIADEEVMSILNDNYKRAKEVLTEKLDLLHEMAKLLMERETIYKEEVDMIMAGKKTEEIVEIMEKREKEQKEKEAKLREEKSRFEKIRAYEAKIAEGEKLVEQGILTTEELNLIKKEFEEYKKSIEEKTEDKIEEKSEAKEVKDEKKEENSQTKVKVTRKRKTPNKKDDSEGK